MIRRKLTLKRVDPWTVLKFGFVVNVALLLVGLLAFWIVWTTIGRLGLVEQFCGSVGTVVLDLQECSLNGGNIFRTFLFLGVLGVVVQTGIFVFAAFLYNLISDLTGGLTFTFLDESGDAVASSARRAEATASAAAGASGAGQTSGPSAGQGQSSGPRQTTPASQRASTPGATSSSAPQSAPPPTDQSSRPARPTPDGQPVGPPQRDEGEGDRPRPTSDRESSSGSLWNDPTRTRN